MATAELTELNEATTPEEISKYVEQVTQEVAAERAGEKSDAQITSEHSDNERKPQANKDNKANKSNKDKPAEELSGSEAAEVDDQSEDSGGQSWLDDDLKAEVAAYGVDESELADFASREELEVALRFFDRRALEAGRKALAETEGEGEVPSRNEKGQFAKVEKQEAKSDPPPKRDGQYEVTLDKDVYDDEVVDEFTRMRDYYDSRLSELEARVSEANRYFAEQSVSIIEQKFDSAVDALNMPNLFGKTGSESPQELERRQDLMVQAKAQQLGLKQLTGRDVDLDSLVARVAPMVFSDEFDKQKLKSRTRKISRQSNGRQGGGATRPQDPREDPRDEADRIYRELEGR